MADKQSREVIGGRRYCGKTTQLIVRANKEQLYILCANKDMARAVFNQAQKMKLDIPFPVTVADLPLHGYMEEVLIDEVEMVLRQLVGKPIAGMSTSYNFRELEDLRTKPNKPNGELKVNIKVDDGVKD